MFKLLFTDTVKVMHMPSVVILRSKKHVTLSSQHFRVVA